MIKKRIQKSIDTLVKQSIDRIHGVDPSLKPGDITKREKMLNDKRLEELIAQRTVRESGQK